ncbi:hypothetical protein V8G54_018627 [Vigna mungo]|uniref:Uncharacterized protein n=1 Tax=Vigna mungo TaxID=3915 RepID=A0AAQ3RUW1_VIGMU
MENNKKKVAAGSSSSSLTNFDHLFGPKDPSTTSSSSTSIFGSIFPPPSTVGGRDSTKQEMGCKNYGAPGNYGYKGENSGVSNKNASTNYQNEPVEPSSYYSSSIFYGGQENYSPRTRTTESHHIFKKDKEDDDPNGNDSNSASRGNWWQGRTILVPRSRGKRNKQKF